MFCGNLLDYAKCKSFKINKEHTVRLIWEQDVKNVTVDVTSLEIVLLTTNLIGSTTILNTNTCIYPGRGTLDP